MSAVPGSSSGSGGGSKDDKISQQAAKAAKNKAKKERKKANKQERKAVEAIQSGPAPRQASPTVQAPPTAAAATIVGVGAKVGALTLASGGRSTNQRVYQRSEDSPYCPSRDGVPEKLQIIDSKPPSLHMENPEPIRNIDIAHPSTHNEFLKISDETTTPDGYVVRPSYSKSTRHVYTNHFKIRLTKSDLKAIEGHVLYEYSIDGINSGHTSSKKKTLMKAAFNACGLLARSRNYWVTDYKSKIVSWYDLCSFHELGNPDSADPDDVIATFAVDDFNRETFGKTSLDLRLRFIREIVVDDLKSYGEAKNADYDAMNEAIGALNLFFAKSTLDSVKSIPAPGDDDKDPTKNNVQVGRNRFFVKTGWEKLMRMFNGEIVGDEAPGKVTCRGYTYGVRCAMGQLMLNINTATSLFYEPMTVADYLKYRDNNQDDLIGVRVYVNFERGSDTKGEDGKNTKHLDTKQARTKTISSFSKDPAKRQEAYKDDKGAIITVWRHMERHYCLANSGDSHRTKGSEMSLCVDTNPIGAAHPAWFLAEDLWILPYQIYRRKIEGNLNSAMIKKACRSPRDNLNAILGEGLKAMSISTDKPDSFQNFGLFVEPKVVSVPARVIFPPNLEFSNADSVNIATMGQGATQGKWQLTTACRFLTQSATLSGNPLFLLPQTYVHQAVPPFFQSFWSFYGTHGAPDMGNLPANFNNTNSLTRNFWRRQDFEYARETAKQNKASIVILLLPRQNRQNLEQYVAFKAVMDQAGIDSLCLCEQKIVGRYKRSDPSSSTSDIANYAYNVGMKLNIRVGNTNHSISSNKLDVLPKDGNGMHDTLILGADVIHPGISRAEGTPSIAALVGSVDEHYGKYLGSMRRQPYDPKSQSKEIIEDDNMKVMARERLDAWNNQNGRYPGNILYYRDGVGDSQFSMVLQREVKMIREAYEEVVPDGEIKITAIVVVKRHNVRLYPAAPNEESKTGNCIPGTVVDSGITHPYNFDFFLISHEGLQGTARPTHYVVLQNDINFDATDIQNLTHHLCYTYQRSTTSVSYAPPAYYADHLCERGRCYLMEFYDGAARLANMDAQQVEQEIATAWARGGRPNGNPWHVNMDDKMFWM